MLLDIEQIIGYSVLLDTRQTQDRLLDPVDKLNCQLQWPDQIGFNIVSLYILLRANQVIFNHCF